MEIVQDGAWTNWQVSTDISPYSCQDQLSLRGLQNSVHKVVTGQRVTWWVENVQDEGRGGKADETGHKASQGPSSPGDGLPQGLGGQVHSQGVGRHGSDEHGR